MIFQTHLRQRVARKRSYVGAFQAYQYKIPRLDHIEGNFFAICSIDFSRNNTHNIKIMRPIFKKIFLHINIVTILSHVLQRIIFDNISLLHIYKILIQDTYMIQYLCCCCCRERCRLLVFAIRVPVWRHVVSQPRP